MSGIVGTIIDVKSYLEQKECIITVHPQHEDERSITLASNRKYIIPSFQRELRWDVYNVNVLISDLSRAPVFLGNIILTIKNEQQCEIIDGQQRTTILILLLAWLKQKYGSSIELLNPCKIDNLSFRGFQTLVDHGFDKNAFTQEDWRNLCSQENDKYAQFNRIKAIWDSFEQCEILQERYSASDLVKNIKRSEFNIIASYTNDTTTSIRYFLDVNLKGVRLDTEDIFKAQLFELDTRDTTRGLWEKNKQNAAKLNLVKSNPNKDINRYPLMKIIEHFFYCDLYKDPVYAQVKFGEDFFLSDTAKIGKFYFYKGTHLIEIIRDCDYMERCLTKTLRAVGIMIEIIESDGPSDKFKHLFICDGKIDSIDIENCHNLLQKILLEKEIIPKILVLKYILTLFDGETHKSSEYKSVYSVFAATVVFSVFANKKESETFYKMVRQANWREEIDKWLCGYISSHDMTRGKMLAAYKCDEDDGDKLAQLRSKSLAAVFDHFQISKNRGVDTLKVMKPGLLHKFLRDNDEYSLEHFIIGDKYKLKIKTNRLEFSYEYPPVTKKYRNSLFNYIFIPRKINNALSDGLIHEKHLLLEKERDSISCKYSLQYLDIAFTVPQVFSQYPRQEKLEEFDSEEEAVKYLDSYFKNDFPEEFLAFATNLLRMIKW